ncbi:MAG: CheR family methyltransferase [bacterium]
MKQREFEYTDTDFNHIRDLVMEKTGIVLTDSKKELVYSRISRRLRDLGMNTFSQYRSYIASGHEAEMEQFTNAITTNLTSFFREMHHFDYLVKEFLPELRKRSSSKSLRIWSAGCSTGEEVYSIAMTLHDALPDIAQWDIRILATDLDSEVLATAASGVYAKDRVNSLDPEKLKRWFLKGKGAQSGKVKVTPELQKMVTFRQLNLMESWPLNEQFDVIFCRNVLIYFDKETQGRLVNRFGAQLEDDGRLIVGHSENLSKVSNKFTLLGKTVYKKAL